MTPLEWIAVGIGLWLGLNAGILIFLGLLFHSWR